MHGVLYIVGTQWSLDVPSALFVSELNLPLRTLWAIDIACTNVIVQSLNPFHINILPLKLLEDRNYTSLHLHFCTPVSSMGVNKCQWDRFSSYWWRLLGRVRTRSSPVIKSVGQFSPGWQIKARLLFNSFKTLTLKVWQGQPRKKIFG